MAMSVVMPRGRLWRGYQSFYSLLGSDDQRMNDLNLPQDDIRKEVEVYEGATVCGRQQLLQPRATMTRRVAFTATTPPLSVNQKGVNQKGD